LSSKISKEKSKLLEKMIFGCSVFRRKTQKRDIVKVYFSYTPAKKTMARPGSVPDQAILSDSAGFSRLYPCQRAEMPAIDGI
jgi:hypothetical protein